MKERNSATHTSHLLLWSRIRTARLLLGILPIASSLGAPSLAGAEERTVLDLQRDRFEERVDLLRGGEPAGHATLIHLNPAVNAWYVLRVKKRDGTTEWFHLENPFPETQTIRLTPADGGAIVVSDDSLETRCVIWPKPSPSPLFVGKEGGRPFGDLCEGRLHLRNPVAGRRTRKEWATDLLRDRFRHGEQITTFVKEKFFRDRYRRVGKLGTGRKGRRETAEAHPPFPIAVDPSVSTRTLKTPDLDIVASKASDGFLPGRWYPADGHPGIFVSAVTPGFVADEIAQAGARPVGPLDSKELSALVYLVAFDLSTFDLGFALGTDHPRVGWSERVPETARLEGLRGPDGFDTVAPLVRTGIVSPHDLPRAAATITGGFKRRHGAFKWGELATKNHGSHYGFIEHGVVLSTLHPGLATLLVFTDGRVEMKTWRDGDSASMGTIRHARQNGVPLVETDVSTGATRPGALVREWGNGNWSGSESQQLRTLRAGVCIQAKRGGQFLIYGYFSAATPAAMARVFQACSCEYAMHLDMNAPEHTYLAVYRTEGPDFVVQRLVKEMSEVDPPVGGNEVPRYVGYADNRDFFYLLRRDDGGQSN